MSVPNAFRFSIDRGGTFTDIYAEIPGEPGYRVLKLLSDNPGVYEDAPREGIRRILQETTGLPLTPEGFEAKDVEWIRMGTTVATNALLERKGARVGLAITKGFRDLLEIGYQNRPSLFDLKIEKFPPLYQSALEIDERVQALSGLNSATSRQTDATQEIVVLKPLDIEAVRAGLLNLLEQGVESLAVVLMHAYAFPEHERRIGELALELGFRHVSLSSQVMNRIKIVGRGQTCCVDAYLTPPIQRYIDNFRSGFKGDMPEIYFMQSDGGLAPASAFSGSRAVLSGPAGGVVGCARTAYDPQSPRPVIGFDMGGTSTDVSRYDGELEWRHESELANVHLQTPQLDIRTVASGGGSRLFYRNGMLAVGPESSGAHPGPVCYRKGGPLSLTDANLLLGRLLPEHFPKVFGPKEDQALDLESARNAFQQWFDDERPPLKDVEAFALGFIEVANEAMARPIREITLQKGRDPKDHILSCFGGAGGQHACALARSLGIQDVFIHRFSGVLSAYGMGLADVTEDRSQAVGEIYSADVMPELLGRLDAMSESASSRLRRQGSRRTEATHYLNLRFAGTDTALMVKLEEGVDLQDEFLKLYRREFGFAPEGKTIIIDDARVRVVGSSDPARKIKLPSKTEDATPVTNSSCYFREGWLRTPVYDLNDLGPGEKIEGPAIILQESSTILIEPLCRCRVTEYGDLKITVPLHAPEAVGAQVDPVQLAIFSNRFMSIAEQMGVVLQKTAISTNIKERQDFSCAVFDRDGCLAANAPHQPVHLGAMGEAVRKQMEVFGEDVSPGDVWVSNSPQMGGSHLPDITVVTPVWVEGKAAFYVANRGHHADIGGSVPGSMPPFSTSIEEEGALINSFRLVRDGVFQEEGVSRLLKGSRRLSDNLSDLKAQVAANERGVRLLQELALQYSLATVQAYMKHIQEAAETSVRSAVRRISLARHLEDVDALTAEDRMDEGIPLCLRLTLDRTDGSIVFDFSGTGPQSSGNLNAPQAVTASVILYCLRCLTLQEMPLNQGCMAPVRIISEAGTLITPNADAAVAAGNVLTSQRLVDVIFKALGVCAASQGCMNNLTFGNETFGYYETIGGGAGAGPDWRGASGVHTHMTNTRITDPEILETRYPVLLREFSLRNGSGGAGRFAGGDGLVREIEFLVPLDVSLLSERRDVAPYGLEGGEPGACGENWRIRADGRRVKLGGKAGYVAERGERIRILTPGGGGYGAP
ncbi:MAG: 5-oxoprolinase [Candidatus Nitrohelix vancouverensis]|uniref:5-oxoprolinase n=1 Tax=Candidatus Nitrohelix vancouverensis TaxID=2705534 RepID=A0A7T0C4S3_9BACT|nr:MAG: 5-oxoprolinase [Candidatus Nitrohelix vancouverensis]